MTIKLGVFSPVKGGGWTGRLRTMSANCPVTIELTARSTYQLKRKESVLGSGKLTKSGAGRPIIRLRIDDPSWAQPIYAALMLPQEGAQYAELIWKRANFKKAITRS